MQRAAGQTLSFTVTTRGGDSLTTTIQIVHAWSATPGQTWTSTIASATAGGDYALEELAYDTTGQFVDDSKLVLPNGSTSVAKGMAVDVTPLFTVLAQRIRRATVVATGNAQIYKNAGFAIGLPEASGYALNQLNAARINGLFDSNLAGLGITYSCLDMVEIIYSEALIMALRLRTSSSTTWA